MITKLFSFSCYQEPENYRVGKTYPIHRFIIMTFYEQFLSGIVGKPVTFVGEVSIKEQASTSSITAYNITSLQYIFSFELSDAENTAFCLQESRLQLSTEIVREFGKSLLRFVSENQKLLKQLIINEDQIANRGVIFFPDKPTEITVMSGYSWEEIQCRSIAFWQRYKQNGYVIMASRARETIKFISAQLPEVAESQNIELEFIIRLI